MANPKIGINPERYGLIVPEALLSEYKQVCYTEGSTPPVELRKAMKQYIIKVKARRSREALAKTKRESESIKFSSVTEVDPIVLALTEKALAGIKTKHPKDVK